ncbi:unnamed protein product [Adineta steineri]|uniref:Uncharacterized protein n=1 Tax=Adineta steineri TaxID=433720 RepID=A0A818LH47_9BILA|nr:unnamed protein product [Adineta steineri]CAF1183309.1 unnamed protein product [Adineta steineri]CAF3572536.1 unnamed protein product [Adineta steineri]CAF3708192.1 unnamed protein product [Adineta steineri]
MSVYNSKANYHPVSALPGSLPTGSYLLPGNGYYSVQGQLPRLRYDSQKFLNDPKYAYSQSYRIDAMQALQNAKKGTSIPRYYSYYPHFEAARERHIFVPKYYPNENPSCYEHKGFEHFKNLASNSDGYALRSVNTLPPIDYVTIPKPDENDDVYRAYQPRMPYDMMVLRDEQTYKTPYSKDFMTRDNSFVSSTTLVPRGS